MAVYGLPVQDYFNLCLLVAGGAGCLLIGTVFLSVFLSGRNYGNNIRVSWSNLDVSNPDAARTWITDRELALEHRKYLREIGQLGQCNCELCRNWSLMCKPSRTASSNEVPTTTSQAGSTTSQAGSITESA